MAAMAGSELVPVAAGFGRRFFGRLRRGFCSRFGCRLCGGFFGGFLGGFFRWRNSCFRSCLFGRLRRGFFGCFFCRFYGGFTCGFDRWVLRSRTGPIAPRARWARRSTRGRKLSKHVNRRLAKGGGIQGKPGAAESIVGDLIDDDIVY